MRIFPVKEKNEKLHLGNLYALDSIFSKKNQFSCPDLPCELKEYILQSVEIIKIQPYYFLNMKNQMLKAQEDIINILSITKQFLEAICVQQII